MLEFAKTPTPGCLDVEKVIDMSDLGDVEDTSFTITVSGPSYPAPDGTIDLGFQLRDGELYVYNGSAWVLGSSYCLYELLPGDYTAEEDAPDGWDDAVIDGSPAT